MSGWAARATAPVLLQVPLVQHATQLAPRSTLPCAAARLLRPCLSWHSARSADLTRHCRRPKVFGLDADRRHARHRRHRRQRRHLHALRRQLPRQVCNCEAAGVSKRRVEQSGGGRNLGRAGRGPCCASGQQGWTRGVLQACRMLSSGCKPRSSASGIRCASKRGSARRSRLPTAVLACRLCGVDGCLQQLIFLAQHIQRGLANLSAHRNRPTSGRAACGQGQRQRQPGCCRGALWGAAAPPYFRIQLEKAFTAARDGCPGAQALQQC
jgi:hypothetical protein